MGLSPRVRGNPRTRRRRTSGGRSIPACAGEPGRCCRCRADWGVYPRVCGGTPSPHPSRLIFAGLSPRVRGNLCHDAEWATRRGSIPACAGEPGVSTAPPQTGGVYPRVCGGTRTGTAGRRSGIGLSPRVRGNRSHNAGYVIHFGSIPACAGEPHCRTPRPPCPAVYPRVCGGTLWQRWGNPQMQGLSPRVRGNPPADSPRPPLTWSIPACAGEPDRPPDKSGATPVYPRVCGGTARCGRWCC